MTEAETTVLRCAYADLKGVVEAALSTDSNISDIDVDSIQCTLHELETQFPDICIGEPESQFDESMDGDAARALASAGFGTDEDYGGCTE